MRRIYGWIVWIKKTGDEMIGSQNCLNRIFEAGRVGLEGSIGN